MDRILIKSFTLFIALLLNCIPALAQYIPPASSGGGAALPLGFSADPYKRRCSNFYTNGGYYSYGYGTSLGGTFAAGGSATPGVTNGYYQYSGSTAATTNSTAFQQGGLAIFSYNLGPTCNMVFTPGTLTNVRIALGYSNTSTVTADLLGAGAAAHGAYFRFSTAAGDTTWKVITSNGSSDTVTDTGVTPVSGTTNKFAMDLSNPANVKFYIDGALKGTNSTTLPNASILLQLQEGVRTLTTSAASYGLGSMYGLYVRGRKLISRTISDSNIY